MRRAVQVDVPPAKGRVRLSVGEKVWVRRITLLSARLRWSFEERAERVGELTASVCSVRVYPSTLRALP